jgi:hypothetical protein
MNTNSLITWTLRSWVRRLEIQFSRQGARAMLPERRYVKFDVDDLVRIDMTQRYANNKVARDAGWLTADEIRTDEDRPPLEHAVGDQPIGNEVLVAMTRGGAALPKSWSKILDVNGRDFGPGAAEGELANQPASRAPASEANEEDVLQPKPQLSVVPPSGPPHAHDRPDTASVRYSVSEIAQHAFGLLSAKAEYRDIVTQVARDAGYEVRSLSSEDFTREQADWIAAESLRRPRPVERFELNGHATR